MSAQQSVFVYVGFSGILSLIIEIVVTLFLPFFANVLLPRTICAEASHTWCWCLVRMVLYAKYSAIYCLDKRRLLLRKMLYFTLKKIGLSWLGNNTKTRNSETL